MALNLLTVTKINGLRKPGRYADGGNLYLLVDAALARRWVMRFAFEGRQVDMGLGGYTRVSLAQARELAAAARALLAQGKNPVAERAAQNAVPTFGEVAEGYLAAGEKRWRNAKHRQQWENTLRQHCASIWTMRVDQIAQEHVLAILEPIWNVKRETASRVRGRIETVLDLKAARTRRSGENPARWRGGLKSDLEEIEDRTACVAKNFAAMHHGDLPAFMPLLRAQEAMAAIALEFTILTAARSGEVLGARWDEIDWTAQTWTVPITRMKSWRPERPTPPHVVPLSSAALQLLSRQWGARESDNLTAYIFPGGRRGRPLSDMSMLMLCTRPAGTALRGYG